MEPKIAALEVKVENLESLAKKHELENDRNHKYMTHMAEDILARMAGIERSAARFESDLAHRIGSDVNTQASLKEIYERIRVLERLVWIACGVMLAISSLATFFGWEILKQIGR